MTKEEKALLKVEEQKSGNGPRTLHMREDKRVSQCKAEGKKRPKRVEKKRRGLSKAYRTR